MKNKKRMILLVTCAFALLLGIGIFGNQNKITVYAASAPYNNPNSADGVRIDGWEAIRDMTIYGQNTDSGCGMTAMAILLQYYNDNSLYTGETLAFPQRSPYNSVDAIRVKYSKGD